eukprot:TRINITY_DN33457_c0_g1_i1.p2 TRINITY_DN33457_c0_g1~~TRINITY_DN33457_c0_g1_i1.p2  ORF type:complete len:214 (+),score=90.08 TRINITY_DN33457_c0_g1_i1:68-709(+)
MVKRKQRKAAGPGTGGGRRGDDRDGGGLEKADWHDRMQKSRKMAAERAKQDRKREGKQIWEYERLLKKEGLQPSEQFLKRKAEYQDKLQKEVDQAKPRQARKRKRRQLEQEEEDRQAREAEGEEVAERDPTLDSDKNPFKKARTAWERRDQEKKERQERWEKEKEERARAIEKAQKQRQNRHKKLNQKTRRGQPIMKNQMSYLMGKIEKSLAR